MTNDFGTMTQREAHYQEVAKLRLELATMEHRAKDAELTAASMISALRPVLSSQFRGDNPVWACGKLVDYIEDMRGSVESLENEIGVLKAIQGNLLEQNATLLTLIRRVIAHTAETALAAQKPMRGYGRRYDRPRTDPYRPPVPYGGAWEEE